MGIEEKLANAKETRWLTEGLTDEEVSKIVDRALEKGRRMREKIQRTQGQAGNGGVLK